MQCQQCGAVNRGARRFCASCAAPLWVCCDACGTVNAPGEVFCGGCGNRLTELWAQTTRHPESAELQRRQLTVMFCDLVGSTALSRSLDPEDLLEVIRIYRKRASEMIARYDGFVAGYKGDGIIVYFGYPRAHEDDAIRAIHTGLDIVAAFDRPSAQPNEKHAQHLDVRIGIATGLVVVGDLIAEGAAEPSIAMGEAPNLAARLQALGKPNSVLIAGETRELARGEFEYVDEGSANLKGFSEPVRVWRVLRASNAESRFDAARSRRLTPLVGRDGELQQLRALWQRASSGEGRVVLLSGEAGIGKSRIAETLSESIAGEPHIRLHYQCSPYHANSPLYPFIHELERAADFKPPDTPDEKRGKLEALLAATATDSGKSMALLAALLSLPTSPRHPAFEMVPQQLKDKTLIALLDRIDALAARAPVLMLLEDAHWIDPTSIELLNLLAPRAQAIRVLAIITSRSAADYAWVGLQHVSSIQVERLDRRQSATMVDRALEGARLPAEVIEQIIAKADGVPLFIEELSKTVRVFDQMPASGSSSLASRPDIPSTLQDSLMARLDHLGSAKEVAQIAAVVGREFTRDLLAALSSLVEGELSDALARLTSSAVVFGRGEPPWTTFTFKHALLRDAAYGSMLRARRRELHARIAEILERDYPERVRTEPEVVAHHCTQAGRSVPAAGYWAAAAQRALNRSANVETIDHATKGLALLADVPPGVERDRLEAGLEILRGAAYRAASGFASSNAERSFTRARELCERLDDVPRLMDATRGLFSCYYARGALALAAEQGRNVGALGDRMNHPGSRMLGHWMFGCVSFWQGAFATARVELEEAFSLYDPDDQLARTLALQIDPGVNSLVHLSWLRWILGFPDQAVETGEKAIATARRLSQPFALAMALFFACATRACCGHHDAARRLLDELLAITFEHGLRYLGTSARVLHAQELIAQEDCDEALQQVRTAFSEFQAQEAGVGLPWSMCIAASAYARLGKADEGLTTLGQAFDAAERNGEHHWEAELWRSKGELLLLAPRRDHVAAVACFRRAIDVARQQQARSLELRATTSLARALLDRHSRETARRALAGVCALISEGADTTDIRDARSVLDAMSPAVR